MRLIELYIENFGKLKGYRYTFSSGLNVINEENGYGKSTLAAFIKSMLFGLEDTRKAKLDENDRKKYMPWQGGAFGGTLTFSVGKKKYRIERTFAPKASDDKFALFDCESGKESRDYSENIGEELFGINVDGFERTVFLSERRLSVKNDNKTISAKLSDLVGCDGDVGELDEAIDLLEERRKYYFKRGGAGRISEIRTDISALDGKINGITRISDALPDKEADVRKKDRAIRELEAKAAELEAKRQSQAHERLYLTKKAAYGDAKRQLDEANGFFKSGVPTQEELREAERAADTCRAMKIRLEAGADVTERREALRRDIAKASGYIESLGAEKEKKRTRKAYPALLAIAIVLAACGGILAAAFNAIGGIALIGIAAITLILAVANFAAVRKNVVDDRLMGEIRDMLASEEGSAATIDEMMSAMIALKAKGESELLLADERAKAVKNDRETLATLCRGQEEFLAKFEIKDGDPYLQIRQRLSELEYLGKRVNDLALEVEGIVREYGIDVERLDQGEEVMSAEQADAMRRELEENIRRMRGELTLLERECKQDSDEVSRLDELYERHRELDARLAESEERLTVINLTKDHLTRAKDLLTAKYLGKTRRAFANYMSMIGEESTELFTMDTSFGITKSEGGGSRPTEAYSLGTQDFFALAARLALVETLYDNELPFVMLDDPFAHFDDKKCATALKVLKRISEKNQIIYLTCSKSRAV